MYGFIPIKLRFLLFIFVNNYCQRLDFERNAFPNLLTFLSYTDNFIYVHGVYCMYSLNDANTDTPLMFAPDIKVSFLNKYNMYIYIYIELRYNLINDIC